MTGSGGRSAGHGMSGQHRLTEHAFFSKLTHLEVLCDFTDESLEGELPDQELRGLLVATNFTKGNGSRAETVRLLYTTGCDLCVAKVSQRVLGATATETPGYLRGRSSWLPSRQAAYGEPFHQWTCGQSA